MPKNVKGGPLGVFELPFFWKIEKNEGDPLKTHANIKNLRKKSHKAEKNLHKKFLVMGGTRTRPSAWQTSKNP